MRFVQMIWPPTKAIAAIPEGAVKGHRGIGWVPLSEWKEPAEPPTPQAPAAEPETPTRSTRRRGANPQE